MKIALDTMGGDHAPKVTVKGAIQALEEKKDFIIILVGKKELIEYELEKYKYDKARIEIKDAREVIEMTDDPVIAVKAKKDSSMNISLELVQNSEANATVSAGNTGALIAASQLKLKRIKGVLRPCIATMFPSKKGHMVILDVGAVSDSRPEFLSQYAILGSKYAEIALEIKEPKVGLLNIGSEEGKGNELTRKSYELLSEQENICFKGNVEPHLMLNGEYDVIVTDGYTGNILLKATEGTAKFIMGFLKEEIFKSFLAKIGGFILKPIFNKMRKTMDSSEYGGAIFLGLNQISVKAHGGSDENGIMNAILAATKFVEANLVEKIKIEIGKDLIKNNDDKEEMIDL